MKDIWFHPDRVGIYKGKIKDAFKPVNVGKLESSQAWRIEKPAPEYY
jgi:hypothetical protein